jgi:hypothetical protein
MRIALAAKESHLQPAQIKEVDVAEPAARALSSDSFIIAYGAIETTSSGGSHGSGVVVGEVAGTSVTFGPQ